MMAHNLEESRKMKAIKDEQDRKINQIEDEKIKNYNYFTEYDNRTAQR